MNIDQIHDRHTVERGTGVTRCLYGCVRPNDRRFRYECACRAIASRGRSHPRSRPAARRPSCVDVVHELCRNTTHRARRTSYGAGRGDTWRDHRGLAANRIEHGATDARRYSGARHSSCGSSSRRASWSRPSIDIWGRDHLWWARYHDFGQRSAARSRDDSYARPNPTRDACHLSDVSHSTLAGRAGRNGQHDPVNSPIPVLSCAPNPCWLLHGQTRLSPHRPNRRSRCGRSCSNTVHHHHRASRSTHPLMGFGLLQGTDGGVDRRPGPARCRSPARSRLERLFDHR